MNNLKNRKEWLAEKAKIEFSNMSEDAMVDIDIKLEDKPDLVLKSLASIDGISDIKSMSFGIIKAKSPKNKISDIEQIEGVEGVEVGK